MTDPDSAAGAALGRPVPAAADGTAEAAPGGPPADAAAGGPAEATPPAPGYGSAARRRVGAIGSPARRRVGAIGSPARRRVGAIGGAVLLAAVIAGAAFLAWGPVGIGPGPLAVGYVSSSGVIPPDGPSMIIIPAGTTAAGRAVIDAVAIRGGGGYRAPRLIRVLGVTSPSCSGIWFPVTGAGGFAARCAPGGTVALLGRALPRHHGAAAIGIALEVGPPGKSGCWSVSRVSVSYHVGGRRWVNVASESLSGCTSE
jgi:hypothetical protein